MTPSPPAIKGAKWQNASALVICLVMIVLTSTLVLGFLATARLERTTASSHAAAAEARRITRIGTDVAMARVQAAAVDKNFWISLPGKIITQPLSDLNEDPRKVDLSSGDATGLGPDEGVNLNLPSLTGVTGLLTGKVDGDLPALSVKWIYILKDNSQSVGLPTFDPDNPVVGRYAFWTDDASARINWNTASAKAASTTSADPSRVDLTAASELTDSDAEAIRQFRESNGLFNSPLSVLAVPDIPDLPEFARQQKFSFVHTNASPEKNLFNEPRILLTTKASLAGSSPDFFDLTTSANLDPGELANLSLSKVAQIYQKLHTHLSREDWPILPGKSFHDKYGDEGTRQLALNIIEYVRSAESARTCVEPLRPVFSSTGAMTALNGGYDYLGSTRRPVITEMAVEVPEKKTGDPAAFQCKLYTEVYLPVSAEAPVELTELYFYSRDFTADKNDAYTSSDVKITSAMVVGGNTLLGPGERRVIVQNHAKAIEKMPTTLHLRAAISRATPRVRLDIAPLGNLSSVDYTPVPGASGMTAIPSVAVNDPFVNKAESDWMQDVSTFGEAPETATPIPTASPQQDTVADGSAIEPWSVQNSAPGPSRTIASPGAIGLIHSGGKGALVAGIPWRTLRLQPKKDGKDSLPDWALCDLFSAPLSSPSAAIAPGEREVGGRINLNAHLSPFADGTDLTRALRPLPLAAALKGGQHAGGTITTETALELAGNIITQTLSPSSGENYAGSVYQADHAYLTPGSLAEIKGISDEGEISEQTIRDVLGLFTTRGIVFQVYAVGQSLQQNASGKLFITGEHRTATIFKQTSTGGRIISEQELGL